MKFLHLVWSNLKRKKLRLVLTSLSVMVAFILFGVLMSIKQALVGGITVSGADRLVVRHKVSIIQLLPQSYQARMLRIPGVSAAVHQTWFGGKFGESKYFFMQCPVVPQDFVTMFPEMLLPEEQAQGWLKTRTGAVVGRKTADHFKWKIGDKVPITSDIWPNDDGRRLWEFDIVGIYDGKEKNTDTTALFFRYDYFDEARPMGKGMVGWYTIRVKNPAEAAEVAKLVDREFENSAEETKTEPEGAFIQGWANQIGDIALITYVITLAVFIMILFVAGNTMAQAVRERTGELGVLKALGFTNGKLLSLVMAESLLLCGFAGVTGLLLAKLLTAGGDPTHGMLPLFFFPTRDLLLGLGFCLVLGLLTGVFPAWRAMRLRVADSLRRM
jgi:putative ABC transport system permease protein